MGHIIVEELLYFEGVLFLWGFFYGMLLGKRETNILLRSWAAGLFFALWFLSIPITAWNIRRK